MCHYDHLVPTAKSQWILPFIHNELCFCIQNFFGIVGLQITAVKLAETDIQNRKYQYFNVEILL